MLARFANDERGNIAIMTVLSFGLILAGVGVGLDYGGAAKEHDRLQDAVDSAVLAAATSGDENKSDLKKTIKDMIHANYGAVSSNDERLDLEIEILDEDIRVVAKTHYRPAVMGMFGHDKMAVNVSSGAPRGGQAALNVALVIDSTESMAGSNMADVRLAVADLIDDFQNGGGDVHMSLVPYTQYVNIGTQRQSAKWLDATETTRFVPESTHTWPITSGGTSPTCTGTGEMLPSYSTRDGVRVRTGEYERRECTGGTPGVPTGETGSTVIPSQSWELVFNGCVGSRNVPDNMTPEASSMNRIPAAMDPVRRRTGDGAWMDVAATDSSRITCGQVLTPLTNDLDLIRTNMSTLVAEGDTYLPSGLMWGWRTLDPRKPLQEAAGRPADAFNVMIFMTDGQNSSWKDGEYHRDAGSHEQRARSGLETSETICTNARNAGIEIFTVAYNLDGGTLGDETTDMLRECASTPDQAFTPDNRTELRDSFAAISKSLADVRLTF